MLLQALLEDATWQKEHLEKRYSEICRRKAPKDMRERYRQDIERFRCICANTENEIKDIEDMLR